MADLTKIYKLTDPSTGEIRYVGLTSKNLEDRLLSHLQASKLKPRTYVHKWIQSLLVKNLQPQIALICETHNTEEGKQSEQYWIEVLRSDGCHLTNLTNGGDGTPGLKHSEEQKRKISESLMGQRKGILKSEEHKKKISEGLKGHTTSKEARKKMSQSHKGNKSMTGKHHSEESKQKMSEARKGKPNGWEGKHRSEETKRKISEASSGENNGMFGKSHSRETKKKQSEARTNYWLLKRRII